MELRDLYREMRDLKPGALTRANVAFFLEEGRLRHETGKFSIASTRHVTTTESQDMITADFWHRRLHPVERRDRKPGEVKIGRLKGADVEIQLSSVSSAHATATQVTRGQWMLADLGSKNGTYVDGVKVKPNEAVPLRSGSVVSFGTEITLTFLDGTAMERVLRQLDPALARVAASPGALDPAATAEITTHRLAGLEPPAPGLIGKKPKDPTAEKGASTASVPREAAAPAQTPASPIKLPTPKELAAPRPPAVATARSEMALAVSCPPFPAVGLASGVPVIVGRAIGCDLILPHPNVSRRHTCFERQGLDLFVSDMGSGNGTWVEKKKVERSPVKVGQEVGVGPYKLTIIDTAAPTPVVNHDLGTRIEGEV